MTVFCAILEQNKRISEMREFIVKIDKKLFLGENQIHQKMPFQYLTLDTLKKNDNCVIFGEMVCQFSSRVASIKF